MKDKAGGVRGDHSIKAYIVKDKGGGVMTAYMLRRYVRSSKFKMITEVMKLLKTSET